MITKDELITVAELSVINQVADNTDSIVETTIEEAVETFKSYIGSRYDLPALFDQVGDNRDKTLLRHLKAWIIRDIYASRGREVNDLMELRYQDALKWLEQIATGKLKPAGWRVVDCPENMPDYGVETGSAIKYKTEF